MCVWGVCGGGGGCGWCGGQVVASASSDQTVRLWNASTGAPLRTLEGHTDLVNSVSFSPDGQVRGWCVMVCVEVRCVGGGLAGRLWAFGVVWFGGEWRQRVSERETVCVECVWVWWAWRSERR